MTEEKKYLSDHIGTYVTLTITHMSEHGAYLSDESSSIDDEVLLPNNQLDDSMKPGSRLEVFLYKDSSDRLIATLETPAITLGETGRLKVADVTNIGAFLDWGLKKDLFLPFKEQTFRVRPGDNVLAALYLDKSERLCATMHIYDYLSSESHYQKNDHVHGTIYQIIENFGAYVAVDDMYSALIPNNEITTELHAGMQIDARVKALTDDGRLTLSLQEKLKIQMRTDADKIYERLSEAGGFLPFHDKTAPAIINREFGISKAAFKRAIGRLNKENRITISDDGIRLR